MAENSIAVYLEHVRSFAMGQFVPIRPLTLLVGENSSGKSTFLAVVACVFGNHPFSRPGFNDPPFNLGTFDTIATYKGGKYGRDESFTIGYSMEREGRPFRREVKATYRRDRGSPALARFEGTSEKAQIVINLEEDRLSGEILLAATPDFPDERVPLQGEAKTAQLVRELLSPSTLSAMLVVAAGRQDDQAQRSVVSRLFDLEGAFWGPFSSVASLAPIRTKPRRTYDELSEDYSPEGDHIPKILARLLNEEASSRASSAVKESLQRFGNESGLFREIGVKKLGKGPDDPFQVQVAVGGPKVNMVDVGYGVSQALPVLLQSVIRRENSLLLIQQPEVHLHPRAQAALGSFLAELAALGQGMLLVETHSDHLIDRIRLHVAEGTLKPEQVQILFFDRPRTETTVYPIDIDEHGNVENAPECYREFFLEEQIRLLQRGER